MNITTTTILNAINKSRAEQTLPPLKFNGTLSTFAQNKANDMVSKNYFSHTSPDGKFFSNFIDPKQYNYSKAAENLAKDFTDTNTLQNAWMNSPLHKANILNPSYQDVGIATKNNYIVTFFGTTPGQNQSPAPLPQNQNTIQPLRKPATTPNPTRPIESRNPMKNYA